MVEVQYNFQGSVWTYTYASGPAAGRVFFQSPQRRWSDKRKSLVLRQVNSDAENKVWENRNPSLVKRCGDDNPIFPTLADAHGVIVRDGWAVAAQPSCGSPEGDGAPLIPYHRGERVWVEQSLSPLDNAKSIPVISIDTLEFFRVPSEYICFVPQLGASDEQGKDYFATPAGPIHDEKNDDRHFQTQVFFTWPAGRPQEATCEWDSWEIEDKGVPGSRKLKTFRPISDVSERRQLFRQQWAVLSDKLAATLDDDAGSDDFSLVDGNAGQVESLAGSDYSGDILGGQLDIESAKHGPVNRNNCCNLAPDCNMVRWQVQVRPGQMVGMENLPHYHVQNVDVEHCPAGRNHGSHCVLWDNRTRCALDENTKPHSCCVPLSEVLGQKGREGAGFTANLALRIDGVESADLPNHAGCSKSEERDPTAQASKQSEGSPVAFMGTYQRQKRNSQLQLERQKRQYQLQLQTQHKQGQQHIASFETTPVHPGEPCQQEPHHDMHRNPAHVHSHGGESLGSEVSSPPLPQKGVIQLSHHHSPRTPFSTCAAAASSAPSSRPIAVNLTISYDPSTSQLQVSPAEGHCQSCHHCHPDTSGKQ